MSAAIPQLNVGEFIIELKKLFLDENITAFEREVKIMRMLQYRFEQEMSEKRKIYPLFCHNHSQIGMEI